MSNIRELGNSTPTVWGAYKASNKWHKNKHHAQYFLLSGRGKQLAFEPSNIDAAFSSGSLNANAPEFKPE